MGGVCAGRRRSALAHRRDRRGQIALSIEDITPHNLRVPDDTATLTHPNGVTGIAKLAGADFDALKGNQPLTALILPRPTPSASTI